MLKPGRGIFFLLIFLFAYITITAQEQTIGLFINEEGSFNGYTLFSPMSYTNTYLIDNSGRAVHTWEGSNRPNLSAYLHENGNLFRTNNYDREEGFRFNTIASVQEIAWDGSVIWEFAYSGSNYLMHHDIEILPNGNVMIIAFEVKTSEEVYAAGRISGSLQDDELWPDHIIEVETVGASGGNIVWEWHIWDHLIQDHDPTKDNYGVVEDHPELIDINYSDMGEPGLYRSDWTHVNSVKYNEEFDQIIICVHHFSEFWVIDHSTSSEEASGHTGGNSGMGGDILYRWGNPQAYSRGEAADQKLFGPHDAQWVREGFPGAGNILIYNNGMSRPEGQFSTVNEIVPPVDSLGNYSITPGSYFGPEDVTWTYIAENPYDFYSRNISGSQRLANGNTLICSGKDGIFFEVTSTNEIIWLYINPVSLYGPLNQGDIFEHRNVFKIRRYAPDFQGFEGHDLIPGDPIEIYPESLNAPDNIEISFLSDSVKIKWDGVEGATFYKVYSSFDPYSGFTEDTTGIFNGRTWTAPSNEVMKYYNIKAMTPYR